MAFAGNSCLMKITIDSYKYKQFIVLIKKNKFNENILAIQN